MSKNRLACLLTAVGFIFLLGSSLFAEDRETDFKGNFLIGYRAVDTDGAHSKYREDFNLDDGIRLFNLSLHYTPRSGMKKLLDRLDLTVNNFGGDPFESFSLSIQKYRSYKFRYERRKAAYFYNDLYQSGTETLDPFMFNFERIMDSGYFQVQLTNHVGLYLNFDRFTKKGKRSTSFDINRIEVEMEQPIEEDFRQTSIGLDLIFKRHSLHFEEKLTDYENTNSLFLPGYADGGESPSYPSSLELFYLNQPYDFKTYTHSLKFSSRPVDGLLIYGAARYSQMSLNLNYREEGLGTDYLGRSYQYDNSGSGSFDRTILLTDFDITYLIFNNLAVIGSFHYNRFDQTGDLMVGSESQSADFGYDSLGAEGGLQYQLQNRLGLTIGYRHEIRKLENLETAAYEDQTTRTGLFGNIKWNPIPAVQLNADYQHGTYEDPYALTAPTSYNRIKTSARLKMNSFTLNGSYQYSRSESDVLDVLWDSRSHRLQIRTGYAGHPLKVFAGYTFFDTERKGERMVAFPPAWSGGPGSFLWDILYEGRSHLFDAGISASFSQNGKIGAVANIYSNMGSWELSRTLIKGYFEYSLEMGLVSRLSYRFVDYKEKRGGFNDYSAHIMEVAFGYRWK